MSVHRGKEAGHYAFATRHSNSLTYYLDTGEVLAAYGGRIYFIDFKDGVLSYDGRSVTINHNCPKIAYDCERKTYYLGTTDYVYKTDDFSTLRKKFKYECLGTNQGMGFDGEYHKKLSAMGIPEFRYGRKAERWLSFLSSSQGFRLSEK